MRRFYQFAIVIASTALGTALAWGAAHLPLSERVAALLTGIDAKSDNVFSLLIYLGMVAGVLMTLGTLGGLFVGVVLARRVGKSDSLLKLKAA